MTLRAGRWLRLLALLAVVSPLVVGCAADHEGGDEASCAALIVFRGSTYLGHGELKRDPATTGRRLSGTVPACDDTGRQEPVDPAEAVRVAELVEVPIDIAFRWNDSIYVREERELPEATRIWFRSPTCSDNGPFSLVADWLGVTTPERPRFDGDLRPPYRLQVHVTEGPARYVGTTLTLHADATTEPTLGPDDVRTSLWEGGSVVAEVSCRADRFRALSLRAHGP